MKKLRLFIMMLMAAMLPLAVQAQVSLPYEYGFEDNDLAADGWTTVDCHAQSAINNNSVNSGTYSFRFHWTTTPPQYLISPELNGTDAGVEVAFYYKSNSTTFTETFMVGYSTTTNDIASFTWGEEIEEPTGNWTLYDNNFPAGTKYIAIQCTSDDQFYFYLDDFVFTALGGCTKPTNLAYSNVTATSVDLSWTAGGSETEWTLEVNGTEVTGITTNPYTLTVNPATNYTVKVKANCSATDASPWSTSVSFTTPCVDVTTLPWMIDFENFTASTVPTCWDNSASTTSTVTSAAERVWGVYAYNGNQMMRMYNYYVSQGVALINTPTIVLPSDDIYAISFKYSHLASCGAFTVSVSNDGGANFTEIGSFEATSTSYDYTNPGTFTEVAPISLADYAGQSIIVQFRATADYGSGAIFVDDVNIDLAPACMVPSALTVDNVTANSANIGWTASGETEWTLEVNGTEMTGITENPYTLTTTANTTYTVRVKANCSATEVSDWSSTLTFTTPCDAVATVEEDFETYTEGLPDCWSKLGAGTVTVQTSQPNSGSNSLRFSGVTGGNIVALPAIESYAGLYLTFSTKPESNSYTSCGSFAVGYVTGDASTFQALATYNYNDTYFDGDVYAVMSIDVSSVPANALLAFNHMSGASYYYWFVDDVNVAAAPTCLRPTDVTVSDITTTSATIAWTDNNETAPQSWTIDLNGEETEVTTNPYTFDNLTAATAYTVKVKANCTDDDESAWSDEVAFATDCEVIVVTADNPYQEGFENEGICWTIEQVMGEEHGWYTLESSNAYEGNAMAVCHWDPTCESRLISPVLDITQLAEPTFTFQHHQASYQNIVDDLHVYYRSSATEEWTLLASYTTEFADWTMETFSLPNPTATYQVAFLGHGNDGNFIWVDDINIFDNAAEPCATPTNVAVNDNVVTWTGAAANYNVQVTVAGEVVIDTTVATTTFTVEGLENNTHASVAVQAVCAEDDLSEWSEAVEFDYTNGINNYSLKANIYPNPTTGNVTVESDAINADITVFDAFGKLMMTSKVATERTELNFSEFAPGVYMVRIANDTAISTIKVVKK